MQLSDSTKDVLKGCTLVLICHIVYYFIFRSYELPGPFEVSLFDLISIVQMVYISPIALYFAIKNKMNIVLGVVIVGGLTFLFAVGSFCWQLLIVLWNR